MEFTKIKLNKTDITGDKELEGAILTIKKDGKEVASWTSVIGETHEVELKDGEYTLTETGTTITDADGVKYDVIGSTVAFSVGGGRVTSKTVRTDFDATAKTGYVVLKNKTELTICDAKKTQSNVSSSGSQDGPQPSMSVSSPQVSSQPSGIVSSDQSQPSIPSQSVSIPSQSVSVPSQSNSTPVSTVKPNTPSDSNSSSISQNSSSKTSESSKGSGTTTKKSTNGQPPVTTTTGNGGNPPQTGHSGSSVTVAALLAAVAALAVLKKKNDD
jgi:LPXTG-motif cell wall-anchored protein